MNENCLQTRQRELISCSNLFEKKKQRNENLNSISNIGLGKTSCARRRKFTGGSTHIEIHEGRNATYVTKKRVRWLGGVAVTCKQRKLYGQSTTNSRPFFSLSFFRRYVPSSRMDHARKVAEILGGA